MLFKKGDVVTIREDLKEYDMSGEIIFYSMFNIVGEKTDNNNTVNDIMMLYKGQKVKIADVCRQYTIKTLDDEYVQFSWTDEMFEEHKEMIEDDNTLMINIIKKGKR